MSVAEIMTCPVTTLGLDDSIGLAGAHFESGGFHHLPVVDSKKRVLGIVSDRDYLKVTSPYMNTPSEAARDTAFMRRKIHTIMTRHPCSIHSDSSIGEAAQLLMENRFSSLLVVDEQDVLKGIVTWKDFVAFIARFPELDLINGELSVSETSETDNVVAI